MLYKKKTIIVPKNLTGNTWLSNEVFLFFFTNCRLVFVSLEIQKTKISAQILFLSGCYFNSEKSNLFMIFLLALLFSYRPTHCFFKAMDTLRTPKVVQIGQLSFIIGTMEVLHFIKHLSLYFLYYRQFNGAEPVKHF